MILHPVIDREESGAQFDHKILSPSSVQTFMDRRSLLSLLAVTAGSGLSGCSLVNGENDVPEFEQTSIRELDRACSDTVEDAATISFGGSGERVEISGRFSVRNISWELLVRPKRDNSNKERVLLRIDQFADGNGDTEVADCSGSIDYEARVSLSKAPDEVVVEHIKEEDGDHESRAWTETVATSSP